MRASLSKTLLSAVTTAAMAVGALTATAVPASAGEVKTICAQDLYVRNEPAGVVIGTLYYGEHFELSRYSPSGQWAEGWAMGSVNKRGWVQAGWFC